MEVKEKLKQIIVHPNESILACLKKMDEQLAKLFMVMEDNKFIGLLSIGDIQRAIIKNISLEEPIKTILRPDFELTLARTSEDFNSIRSRMIQYRTEFMPVVDEKSNLVNVLFWEDIFGKEKAVNTQNVCLPVVIMAGGKGTRLKPITNVLPKALIPIGDRTILEHILDRFQAVNCHKFFMSVNYKAEMIEHYFKTLDGKVYDISFFKETSFLGTAGSLYLLKGKLDSSFFVSNCDIIIDADYSEVYKYHLECKNDITIVGALKHYAIPYGVLETGESGKLQSIQEKPELTFKINSGMYILESKMLQLIPENVHYHITELIEDVRKSGGKVGVFPVSEGAWMDIGEWSEYNKTIKRLGLSDQILY